MRYRSIPASLFIRNRQRLMESLPPGAVCIIHANDIPQTNADGIRRFIQNSNLFWLSGIEQEETILVLCPEHPKAELQTILFIAQSTDYSTVWEGSKLTKESAFEISGIETIYWTTSFESVLKKLMSRSEIVYLSVDHHPGRILGPADKNLRFATWCRDTFPLHQYHNASPILQMLRAIKSADEIAMIRRSCEITHAAFVDACKVIGPGTYEYEIEAEYARTIIAHGARGFAYEPIIASGENSCILHYTANDRVCNLQEVILMDVGASYGNFASDMTRTVPVSGAFTHRQRQVYDAVLGILRAASSLMKPGVSIQEYHDTVDAFADEALVELGLFTMRDLNDQSHSLRKKFFPHRTMHQLGLDVHDGWDVRDVFETGMVVTCEPGIYLAEERFGIRIENDILITGTGNEDLMAAVPIEAEEVESLILDS